MPAVDGRRGTYAATGGRTGREGEKHGTGGRDDFEPQGLATLALSETQKYFWDEAGKPAGAGSKAKRAEIKRRNKYAQFSKER